MAKFLTGNDLNSALENILEGAERKIILICPYIKLHDRIKSSLLTKIEDYKLEIILVFGKNENDLKKSLSQDDLKFFTSFPNIEIRYEKRLHAKYYANESSAILTSMNLYTSSQDNNIESGILMESSILGELTTLLYEDTVDKQTATYFSRVIHQSKLLFKKVPEFDNGILGLNRKYKSSIENENVLSDFFKFTVKSARNYPPEMPQKIETLNGYCIRTGKPIPFNLNNPFSVDAIKLGPIDKLSKSPEKYCHFSGEDSNGQTSFSRPILSKNWSKAKSLGLVK